MSNHVDIPLYEATHDLKKHKQLEYKRLTDEKLSDSVYLVGEITYEFEDTFKNFISKADAIKLVGNNSVLIIGVKTLAGITEDNEEISLHFENYADYYTDDYNMSSYIRTIRFSKATLELTYDVEEAIDMFSCRRKLHKKSKVML